MKAVTIIALLLAVSIYADKGSKEDQDDRNVTNKDVDNAPSFISNGGVMHLSVNDKWVQLKWDSLAEVNSNGQIVHSEELDLKHYAWSQVEDRDLEDERGHKHGEKFPNVNFSLPLSNGAWFNISAWVVTKDVTLGNVTAKRNSVKFNIYIGNWTFANVNDTLVLTADVNGHGGSDDRAHEDDDLNGDDHHDGESHDDDEEDKKRTYQNYSGKWSEKRLRYANGFLSSPNQATYDGNATGHVNVTHTLTGKPIVTWTFVSFISNVSYDPVFGTNGSVQMLPSFLLLVLLSICALFRN